MKPALRHSAGPPLCPHHWSGWGHLPRKGRVIAFEKDHRRRGQSTSPMGSGRRKTPGEGGRRFCILERANLLTPTLSLRERGLIPAGYGCSALTGRDGETTSLRMDGIDGLQDLDGVCRKILTACGKEIS